MNSKWAVFDDDLDQKGNQIFFGSSSLLDGLIQSLEMKKRALDFDVPDSICSGSGTKKARLGPMVSFGSQISRQRNKIKLGTDVGGVSFGGNRSSFLSDLPVMGQFKMKAEVKPTQSDPIMVGRRALSSTCTERNPHLRHQDKSPDKMEKMIAMAVKDLTFDQDLKEEEEEEKDGDDGNGNGNDGGDDKERVVVVGKPAERLQLTNDLVGIDKRKPLTHKKTDNPLKDSNVFDVFTSHPNDLESFLLPDEPEKVESANRTNYHQPHHQQHQQQSPQESKSFDMYSLIDVKPIKKINVEVANRELPKTLVPIDRIPAPYQSIFSNYKQFNLAQSKIFQDALHSSKTMVISAPTGSGKTAIFELAIVRLLKIAQFAQVDSKTMKIVYIAPLKTLCHERFLDWSKKFAEFGLHCVEMTGDSEDTQYQLLTHCSVIFTTPEKWDTLVRFAGFEKLVKSIKLILIDEVHLLADKTRGPKLEAIITRFKTLQRRDVNQEFDIRFIAVSATAPNTEDLAQWLGDEAYGAVCYNLDDRFRSVSLTKKVIGCECPDSVNDFMFLQKLNWKLSKPIKEYSKNRPTLIFSCTRKDCQTTAEFLAKESNFCFSPEQKNALFILSKSLNDNKLKLTLPRGVGFHHAGLTPDDRHKLEVAFLHGNIPVLIATSTLAMGVNFPAHLVIIKGTSHYVNGSFVEYGESEVLQMMGRAGRPQFDDSGYAVILTKSKNESKFKKLVDGEKVIESNIYQSLAEIFMAEIERHMITSISQTFEWVQSTFFYIRVHKDKEFYNLDSNWTSERVEQKIQDICIKELNGLKKYGLIEIDPKDGSIKPTDLGRMMAVKSISFQTMCTFIDLKGTECLRDLLTVLTKCQDINQDVNLRNNERKHLNQFNTRSRTETARVIRFPLPGKIKTKEMKINVLLQATLGCIPFPKESSLLQETGNLIKVAQRLSRCLVDVALIKATNLKFLLNCIILAKCLRAGIWENSKFVSKQIPRIGLELSSRLVDADLTTFQKLGSACPRTIEMFCRRNLTFGDYVVKESRKIPRYTITVTRAGKDSTIDFPSALCIRVTMVNWDIVKNDPPKLDKYTCILLIGDGNSKILEKQRVRYKRFDKNNGFFEKILPISRPSSSIFIHFIDEYYCGPDVNIEYFPRYLLTNGQETVRKIQSINQCDNIFKASPPKPKKSQKDANQSSVRFDEEIQICDDEGEVEIINPKTRKTKENKFPALEGIDIFDADSSPHNPGTISNYFDLMGDDEIDLPNNIGL